MADDTKENWTFEGELVRLRRTSGDAYKDHFLPAFAAYVRLVTDAVVDAPPEKILNAQGQAQAMQKLLMKFTDALTK